MNIPFLNNMSGGWSSNESLDHRNGSQHNPPIQGGDHFDMESYNIMVVSFFSVILLTGFAGNIMVLGTILRWKKLRNSCGLLIANISTADLGVAVVAAPLRIAERYLNGWHLGNALCKLIPPLQELMVCVSVATHSTIALERYRATVTPFKPGLSAKKTRLVIAVIWCACYVFGCLPLAVPLKVQSFNGTLWCFPQWSLYYRRVYEIYLVLVFIVAQLIIQSFAYISIIRTLNSKNDIIAIVASRTEKLTPGTSFDSRASCTGIAARIKRKEKLVKMLLVLVVTFQICNLPRAITMLIREFTRQASLNPYFEYIDLIALALYYLKHVINPFILYAMSADFRQGFLKIFMSGYCCNIPCYIKKDLIDSPPNGAVRRVRQVDEEPEEDEVEDAV